MPTIEDLFVDAVTARGEGAARRKESL